MPIIALVDCNSFYASCETAFRPDLRGRPVVVLSNNDGCVVARNAQAKLPGMAAGVPLFQVRPLIEKHGITVFSSNYALYGDMSRRVMQTLANFSPLVEVYSIDEAFLSLDSTLDPSSLGREIRKTVAAWTGIPVSVGIGPTKVLAKIANRWAKDVACREAVLSLMDYDRRSHALRETEVEHIWGIGHAGARRLRRLGICNALQLSEADDGLILKELTVVGLRLVHELRGIPSLPLRPASRPRKEIMVSRSFGRPVTALHELQAAMATYMARAAEKLRRQRSLATVVMAFCRTGAFRSGPAFGRGASVTLKIPTAYTPDLIAAARSIVSEFYEPGYQLTKAGVILSGLVNGDKQQRNLFDVRDHARHSHLMNVMDEINETHGRRVLRFAAEEVGRDWETRFERRSPRYTTRWNELPQVRIS